MDQLIPKLNPPAPPWLARRFRFTINMPGPNARANILPIIRDIQAAGDTSLNAIAGQVNARKIATANGARWRHV